MRYFFEVSYNGTRYHGWQTQQNANSVQQTIEDTMHLLLQQEISITGSGRTDTGVHCRQQFFHTDLELPYTTQDLKYKLNSFLPYDISINAIWEVKPDAHARFKAESRSYEYHIHTRKDPFLKDYSHYYPRELNIQNMNDAATLLLGSQDFEAFSKVKTEVNNFICDISAAYWVSEGYKLTFYISANRFLRGMVRAITGTLIDIGTGKLKTNDLKSIIESKNRRKAGASMPAHGLFLTRVKYPQDIFV